MRAYERLMKYVLFPTASSVGGSGSPSTPGQMRFAEELKQEMKALGITEVTLDENGYLFGAIPSNISGKQPPVLGFIAHLDVSPDAPSVDVRPRLISTYNGNDLALSAEITLSPADCPALKAYIGEDLIVTDGNTLLGADDKAGIAEILTLAEILLADHTIAHGRIMIGFTPDEEIGRGADHFDVRRFGADFAYTVDGGGECEVTYETFNAAATRVTIRGRGIHPGEAKGRLLNAQQVAIEFHNLLPAGERPEHTEGYEGFFHLVSMRGEVELAELGYILRDHDAAGLLSRKHAMEQAANFLNGRYGEETVKIWHTDSYRNMAEGIAPYPELLEYAFTAIREAGGEPLSRPLRGGTDGARLTYMGLPCPNLGTGSHNHHSRTEFASVQAMDRVVQYLLGIVRRFAGQE